MIIAEIGINHNGDLQLAKSMIRLAKMSGADVVKFQKRNPDKCVPEHQKPVLKDTPWGRITYLAYKKKIEFGKQDYDEIDRYCKEIDIKWTASVWDMDSLEFMKQYKVPFIKIPSALATNKELVSAARESFDMIVVSTGMTTEDEMTGLFLDLGAAKNVVVMHCTSTYPTKQEHENLSFIKELKQKLPWAEIGYSGHELNYDATIVARALGCKWIERHFTLSKDLWGTDQKASLEPEQFKNMVKSLRKVDILLGKPQKIISDDELAIRTKLRK